MQIKARSHCSLADARKQLQQASATSNPEYDSYASAAHRSPHTVNQLTHPSNQNLALECENQNEWNHPDTESSEWVTPGENQSTEYKCLGTTKPDQGTEWIKLEHERDTVSDPPVNCARTPGCPPSCPALGQTGSSVGGSQSLVRSPHNPKLQKAPTLWQNPLQSSTVLLPRSWAGGNRHGVVSPATKQPGDRPQCLSNMSELKWSGGWSTGTVGWLSASERGHDLEGWPTMNTKCLVPLPFLPDLILWSSENRSHGSPVLVPPETQ